MVKINGVSKAILDKLYENFNNHSNPVSINDDELAEIQNAIGVNKKEMQRAIIELKDYNFIKSHTTYDYSTFPRTLLIYESHFFHPLFTIIIKLDDTFLNIYLINIKMNQGTS